MKVNNLYITKQKRGELRNNVLMPEKILWRWIKKEQLGYKFRRQHGISKYVVDFYCVPLRLVVEIDGQVHDEIMEQDRRREEYLKSLGLAIKRYTAREINNNLEWVLADLKDCCDKIFQQRTANPCSPPW